MTCTTDTHTSTVMMRDGSCMNCWKNSEAPVRAHTCQWERRGKKERCRVCKDTRTPQPTARRAGDIGMSVGRRIALAERRQHDDEDYWGSPSWS